MKKILGFFCLVASLASCDVTIDSHEPVNGADSSAIGFNVYVNRGVTTKAGYKGDLTTAKLENEAGGFGVFAYYGDGALYNETSKPDFMYNQPVTYNPTYEVWDYKPVKYWPNEYGTAAGSQSADRLTFFAYAPYVDVTPSTGIVTEEGETGILGMTRNIAPGDPMIRYGANFKPGQGVDLCWGVAKEAFTSSVDGNSNDVKAGEPFLNVVKPKTGDRLKFDFNHALTQLNVTVDADIDVENGETGTLATETKIYVRSVTFTGFTARGSLNLNSKAGNPAWFDMAGTGRVNRDPVIIHDGRSDGMEGVPTATDVNELPRGLNPKIIQTGEATVGVTNEKVNLFESNDDDAPIMVIPVAGVPMTVTIVYDIETEDPSLGSFLSDGSTHGISIENKITRSIKMNSADLTLVSGRKYTINLHLGLTSVKFDATVGGWDDNNYSSSVDMPINTSTMSGVTLTPSSSTVWAGEGSIALPAVSVKVIQNATEVDVADASTISWETLENPDVASYDATNKKININGMGVAKIRATAIYQDQTMTADYTVNVNEVTAISVAKATVAPDGTQTITATLTHTNNGDITTWPTVSWSSDATDYVTVAPDNSTSYKEGMTTKATTIATGVAAGSANVSATVDNNYVSSSSTVSDFALVTCSTPINITDLYVSLNSNGATVFVGETIVTPVVNVTGDSSEQDDIDLNGLASVSWESNNTSVATVDPSTGDITLKGVIGRAILTVTASYGGLTEQDYFLVIVSVSGSFRGYDVSRGILKKEEGAYKITSGTDLEIVNYFGNDDNLGVYYHRWLQLQTDFGDDGKGGINPTMTSLNGWSIPTAAQFSDIVFGRAASITLNGASIKYGYALVEVTNIPGILLIPDGATITCPALNNDYVGPDPDAILYNRMFSELPLTASEFAELEESGCIFLPCTGYCARSWSDTYSRWDYEWRNGPEAIYTRQGCYWCATYLMNEYSELHFYQDYDWNESDAFINKSTNDNVYYPVRLVKKRNN